MKTWNVVGVLALAIAIAVLMTSGVLVTAQEDKKLQTAEHPYKEFAPWMETSLPFATDVSFPDGPAFRVKIYKWVIGPQREVPNFPLEGFATIEVMAGELETTMNGTKVHRVAGEYWVVQEGTKLAIKVNSKTGPGDNVVSLRGVVLVRK